MSAKDVIVEILEKGGFMPNDGPPEDIAQQILDSLPKLDRDKVNKIVRKAILDKQFKTYGDQINWLIDQICSLVPAGEVVATGKPNCYSNSADGDVVKVGGLDLWDYFCEKDKPGTLIWVPDKEVE